MYICNTAFMGFWKVFQLCRITGSCTYRRRTLVSFWQHVVLCKTTSNCIIMAHTSVTSLSALLYVLYCTYCIKVDMKEACHRTKSKVLYVWQYMKMVCNYYQKLCALSLWHFLYVVICTVHTYMPHDDKISGYVLPSLTWKDDSNLLYLSLFLQATLLICFLSLCLSL